MNIHEYQAKELLAQFGVPVPAGYPAMSVEEAVEAANKLPGPLWVVKAQIHAGGRGKGKFKELGDAAKGGVHGLTTGMAREFARDGITVNTVAPCAVNTPQMVAITKRDPALAAKFVSVIPMGRPAEMEEVASMVSYLASAEASFVTGQVISVNGGSTML